MAPTLYLGTAPHDHALMRSKGRVVITPNPRAAAALHVPHRSLHKEAQAILREAGLMPVDAFMAFRLMQTAAEKLGFRDRAGTARRFAPVMAELFRSDANVNDLLAFEDPRVQQVGRFAKVYTGLLQQVGRYDPAQGLWLAARRLCRPRNVLIHAYPRFGPDEEAFLCAWAGPDSAVVLPHGEGDAYGDNLELAERLVSRGWCLEREPTGVLQRPLAQRAWVFADQEAEVRGVLAHVKELLQHGVAPDAIALVVRDEMAYGPMALAIAQELGVPLHAAYQVPLRETRLGHWVGLLTEVIEDGYPFEKTFRLLGHSLCGVLEAGQLKAIAQGHPNGWQGWLGIGITMDALDWPMMATRREWGDRLKATLQAFGVLRRAQTWAIEAIAQKRLQSALRALARHSEASIARMVFLTELREVLALETTPAAPARGGVSLHRPLALFGARVAHLFVLGAAEDHLPARIQDDPVLDFAVRKRLQASGFRLEDARGAAYRERLGVEALLLVACDTLTLTYPRLLAGKAQLPSPLYGWLGLVSPETPEVPVASVEMARRVMILHGHERGDTVLGQAIASLTIEKRREGPGSLAEPDPYDGFTGVAVDWRSRRFSSSQLVALGQCGFKWWMRHVLKAQESNEPEDGVRPHVVGQLYHKTLELACRGVQDHPEPRDTILAALDSAIREAELVLFDELNLSLADHLGWEAQREAHLTQLRRAVAHASFLDPDARIIGTERDFGGEWRGFRVKGRVDRIDARGDGVVIIDYKTGASNYGCVQDADRLNTLDIQLPIYLETAAPALHPEAVTCEAGYVYLGKPKRDVAKVNDAAIDALVQRLKLMLEAGDFRVAPDRKRKACTYCDYRLSCRSGARLDRKES